MKGLAIILFILLFAFQEYRISEAETRADQYERIASMPNQDSIVINCVRCNWENIRYLYNKQDTSNGIRTR